jgi:FMN phosphatase YigB (HAD superfamily)
MMLKAVLFDLDNTLIHYSEREFFERYIVGVMGRFADIMPGNVFVDKLLRGTQSLLRNNGEMSNAERFLETFCADHGELRQEVWTRFMRFYETEYDELRSLATVLPEVRDVFLRLAEKDVKLVIASNPIWPLAAQAARLSWAGIGDLRFDLITHIENTTYCKPNLEYYREICGTISETPEACLMVGNDPVNDMVVAHIGMKTYLVTDADEADTELSRSTHTNALAEIPEPDFQGSLSAVVALIEGLLREEK